MISTEKPGIPPDNTNLLVGFIKQAERISSSDLDYLLKCALRYSSLPIETTILFLVRRNYDVQDEAILLLPDCPDKIRQRIGTLLDETPIPTDDYVQLEQLILENARQRFPNKSLHDLYSLLYYELSQLSIEVDFIIGEEY